MRRHREKCLVGPILVALAFAPAEAHDPGFITFSVPGAAGGSDAGTFVTGVNAAGAAVGIWRHRGGPSRAFLRTPDGKISPIVAEATASAATQPAINDGAAIAGFRGTTPAQGFLQTGHGSVTVFDLPDSKDVPCDSTPSPAAIGADGTLVGSYLGPGPDGVTAFVRTADGKFTSYRASRSAGCGTFPTGINPAGVTVGYYCVETTTPSLRVSVDGFTRTRDGVLATLDVPGAVSTSPSAINPAGDITGSFYDADNNQHGFLRTADRKYQTFDVPGASTAAFQGTIPVGIDKAGDILGDYVDAAGVDHGFLRCANGKIDSFDVPDAGNAKPVGIALNGIAAGNYLDADGTSRGFLLFPRNPGRACP